jgi:hypothetical protein
MLTPLVIVAMAWFGDPSYLIRVSLSLLVGACLIALGYLLALPQILPMWPGVLALLVVAVIGVAWELQAAKSLKRLRCHSVGTAAFCLTGRPRADNLRC